MPPPPALSCSRVSCLLLLAASLLNITHITLWLLSSGASPRLTKAALRREYSYKGHDYPELLPLPNEMQAILVPIRESTNRLPLGANADAQWLSLSPPGFGYVRLGPEDRAFVVSTFHELHCLRMINRAFSGPNITTLGHVKHCLNYIRQNILCAPDLALEPGDFEARDSAQTYGVHECKNWDVIHQFVTDNYEAWSEKTGYAYTPSPIYQEHSA